MDTHTIRHFAQREISQPFDAFFFRYFCIVSEPSHTRAVKSRMGLVFPPKPSLFLPYPFPSFFLTNPVTL